MQVGSVLCLMQQGCLVAAVGTDSARAGDISFMPFEAGLDALGYLPQRIS